jgi:hypothetical protein
MSFALLHSIHHENSLDHDDVKLKERLLQDNEAKALKEAMGHLTTSKHNLYLTCSDKELLVTNYKQK